MKRLLLLCITLAGCASGPGIGIDRLTQEILEPTDPATIEFYISDRPEKEYREIAILTNSSWSGGSLSSGRINRFKLQAANLGADAVIYTGANTGFAGENPATGQSLHEQIFTAIAIKYR